MKLKKALKLKKIMKEMGVGAAELSELSGIGLDTLYRRLRGESDFKVEDILKISNALGFDENKILNIFFNNQVS